jgi:hypothetical protein
MVMTFCEEEILVEDNELLDDADELAEGKELEDGNELVDAIELVEETIKEETNVETDVSDDNSWDVDEINNDTSLEERLGKVIEVHPVKIPVSQVNKMMGWMVRIKEDLGYIFN